MAEAPALAGRVFLLTAFGTQMTAWAKPGNFPMSLADTVTGGADGAILSMNPEQLLQLLGEEA